MSTSFAGLYSALTHRLGRGTGRLPRTFKSRSRLREIHRLICPLKSEQATKTGKAGRKIRMAGVPATLHSRMIESAVGLERQ